MLVLAMMLAATGADDLHGWARFARSPVLAHTSEQVEVATQGSDAATGRRRYVMRLTRRRLGKVTEVLLAEGASCPAVTATVAAMRDLPVPRVASPDDDQDIVLDGIGYSFEGPARWSNGGIVLSSNVGTPLAAWVDARLAALAPCWAPAKS